MLRRLPDDAGVIFAYEPVWAIGAAQPAHADHVRALATRLRRWFVNRAGQTRLVYGGAAGPGLFPALARDIDGLFLGRSAHDVQNLRSVFAEMNAFTPSPARRLTRPPL